MLSGAETADSGLTVATPLLVEWLGQLRGSLRVIGDVQLDGVIEPGSVFTPSIEVSGAVRSSATAVHKIAILGYDPFSVDGLGMAGEFVLGGELDVTVPSTGTFAPPLGTEWVIASFARSSGRFAQLGVAGLPGGLALALKQTATDLRIVVVNAGPPTVAAPRVELFSGPSRTTARLTFDADLNWGPGLGRMGLLYGRSERTEGRSRWPAAPRRSSRTATGSGSP